MRQVTKIIKMAISDSSPSSIDLQCSLHQGISVTLSLLNSSNQTMQGDKFAQMNRTCTRRKDPVNTELGRRVRSWLPDRHYRLFCGKVCFREESRKNLTDQSALWVTLIENCARRIQFLCKVPSSTPPSNIRIKETNS